MIIYQINASLINLSDILNSSLAEIGDEIGIPYLGEKYKRNLQPKKSWQNKPDTRRTSKENVKTKKEKGKKRFGHVQYK